MNHQSSSVSEGRRSDAWLKAICEQRGFRAKNYAKRGSIAQRAQRQRRRNWG
jgi:hypothetical protein